ncbi:MAG: SGNH/GDSL hydrolase family protein [Candidatus Saccharimonadales bacterium]
MTKPGLIVIIALSVAAALFVLFEVAYIKLNGRNVMAPTIPRQVQDFGTGPQLRYLVMGDSTSIGQGTDYQHSYAYQTAQYLGQDHSVSFMNVGQSGARAADVASQQLPKALAFRPDVVLLAVGANDATHLTSGSSLQKSLQAIINGLRQGNPAVKIVVTGSPEMSAVPRFPWPINWLAGLRTRQVNKVYSRLISQNHLVLAPIAQATGPAFKADPTLFAADNFHPNARGYQLWIHVIETTFSQNHI